MSSPQSSPLVSGMILPTSLLKDTNNIYRWMIPTLEYFSSDYVNKRPISSLKASTNSQPSTLKSKKKQQSTNNNNDIKNDININVNNTDQQQQEQQDIQEELDLSIEDDQDKRHWKYSIETLCRALDEIYNTCLLDSNIEKCNTIITTLTTMINDFDQLRLKLEDSVSSMVWEEPPPISSSSSPPRTSLSPPSTPSSNPPNNNNDNPHEMKWSDRLKQAIEQSKLIQVNSQSPTSVIKVDDKEIERERLNWEIISYSRAKQLEDRQEKAKQKREDIWRTIKQRKGVNAESKVREFNKRTEHIKQLKQISIDEKQERADQLHDHHINHIKNKATSESMRAEEVKWIMDESSKTDRYFQVRKLEKLEARRIKLASEKKKKMSDINAREEAASKRRMEIEASRSQILLGYMPTSPPIQDDYKRKIRRYCKYCRVAITSDDMLEGHLKEPEHITNAQKYGSHVSSTIDLMEQVGAATPLASDWVVTLPFDHLSTNRLAPLSKELIDVIKESEITNMTSQRCMDTKSTLHRLTTPVGKADNAIDIEIPSSYYLESTYTRILDEIDSHLARRDYTSLQYLLIDTDVIVNKYSSTQDRCIFAKMGILSSLTKICLSNDPKQLTHNLIKTCLEMINKITSSNSERLISHLVGSGHLMHLLELFNNSILSKPDIIVSYLPPLVTLINSMFQVNLLYALPLTAKQYKLEFINYMIDLNIFEKLELKLPQIQLGLLEANQSALSFSEEITKLLLQFTQFHCAIHVDDNDNNQNNNNNNSKLILKPITSTMSLHLMMVIKKTNIIGILSLLTFVLLRNKKKNINEIAPAMRPIITNFLQIIINLSIIDLPFIQSMLGSDDYQVEFYHFINHLLLSCTSKSNNQQQSNNNNKMTNDELESTFIEKQMMVEKVIVVLGYYSTRNHRNMDILHWGDKCTILQQLCTLPFFYYFEKYYRNILFPTLIILCMNKRNKEYIQQEINIQMLISFLQSHHQQQQQSKESSSNSIDNILNYISLDDLS